MKQKTDQGDDEYESELHQKQAGERRLDDVLEQAGFSVVLLVILLHGQVKFVAYVPYRRI
jgi:hypothetical protein